MFITLGDLAKEDAIRIATRFSAKVRTRRRKGK